VPSSKFVVSRPSSASDLESYYALRYEVLRRPWGQASGTERDAEEETSIHAFIKENNKVLAVGRLQFVDENTAQVRFMAVAPDQQGKGLGKMVLFYLEERALESGRNRVILHARENALKFYESCGYRIIEKSHLLWGEVQHWLMEKELYPEIKETLAKYKDYKGGEIEKLVFIKTLYANSITLDDTCEFFDKKEFDKLAGYEIAKYNTRDYIRIIAFEDSLKKYFLAALIDPVELYEDSYVKRLIEIDETAYKYLIANREADSLR